MGIGTVKAAVADAGPLIHLNEIGCLELLRIFNELHIPDAVWSETIGQQRISQDDILSLGVIQRHGLSQTLVDQFVHEKNIKELQNGESECLCLCHQIGISTLLTDDLAVREKAKLLKLIPVGSLGIIVAAYRSGRISAGNAKRYIIELYDVSSLFVTRAIVELAIEQLEN